MKTKDQKVMPFTATYQLIDQDRGIHAYFLGLRLFYASYVVDVISLAVQFVMKHFEA
jgi:hypothetical protein